MISKLSSVARNPEWMDLKALQEYADVSERTLRENPLPAVQVDRGKILVRRSHFDRWLEAHPFRAISSIDVGRVADEIINQFRKAA
jgi:hypothetical protein